MRVTLVVFPYDTELYYTFWDLDDVESFLVSGVGGEEVCQAAGKLVEGLSRED